jgi:hypothetical protein
MMEMIFHSTYTALILSIFVLGNELILTGILVTARGDGQCIRVFLQPILNILGFNRKVVELIFSQLHIIVEPEWNTNMMNH